MQDASCPRNFWEEEMFTFVWRPFQKASAKLLEAIQELSTVVKRGKTPAVSEQRRLFAAIGAAATAFNVEAERLFVAVKGKEPQDANNDDERLAIGYAFRINNLWLEAACVLASQGGRPASLNQVFYDLTQLGEVLGRLIAIQEN